MLAEPSVSPAVRRLWMVGGSLAAVVVLVFGLIQAVSVLAHEEETVVTVLDDMSQLRTVEVRNGAGSVHVAGTADDAVTITARVSHGLRSTGHGHRTEGDRLIIDASCPTIGSTFCGVTYDVEVPEDVALVVRAGNGGVTVSDVSGDVDLESDNGRVEAVRLAGDARLRSDNGRVTGTELTSAEVDAESDNGRVELSFRRSPRAVAAASDNGRVEVVLPNRTADTDVEYRVEVSSDNGTTTNQVRTDPFSSRSIDATSDNGSVTVRYALG